MAMLRDSFLKILYYSPGRVDCTTIPCLAFQFHFTKRVLSARQKHREMALYLGPLAEVVFYPLYQQLKNLFQDQGCQVGHVFQVHI